jgi:tetratricopeptide (TPR) repeat protein
MLATLVLMPSRPGWAKVRAWEGTITVPTYGWQEDINPKFWALEDQVKGSTTVKAPIVYPYTMQDHLSRTKADRTYRALFLENEYLKVTCLPELGGRLHSVLDKTTGQETFHLNHVIKPSMIAMRGAFISGGVEWNAGPQVHTVTIVSPVDALVGTRPDGSAYLEVSNLEKTLRTRWTVRVMLHPGRACLEEQVRITNPVDAVNPYYFWNCTAFPCRAGTRFIYPMTLGTDHNGVQFFAWPVHEGRDLSWLKNYETSSSIFAVDCVFDFFGAYDVDANRGVVQVANHYELVGKKAWTWGTWDFGLVCERNLTDDDGPYIEVQSGPLPTQSDYGMMWPRQEVAWQEWWYPVHGLGDGFEFATKDLAFNTARSGNRLDLRILATGRFPKALCRLSQGSRLLLTKSLDLSPDAPRLVTASLDSPGPVDVMVRAGDGSPLASFTTPLPIPQTGIPVRPGFMDKADAQLMIEEKLLKAQKLDLATNRKKARQYYELALADDPNCTAALRGLAILDTEAGLYLDAASRLEKVVGRDAGDGLAWYFLGVDLLRTNEFSDALRCARQATRCIGTTSLAMDLAGRAHAAMGQYPAALEAFRRAVSLNANDGKAGDHLLLALYAVGDRTEAFKHCRHAASQQPTALVPRALLALQGKAEMERFVREARGFMGEDDFEMLETGLVFAEVGLAKEAALLVSKVCIDAVAEKDRNPLVMYYLAWLAHRGQDEEQAGLWLGRAAALSRECVFPSRPEELVILEYALARNPSDAQDHLHVGNLYAHLGRTREAADHWQRAVELNPSLSVAYRNLGLYAWSADKDLARAEQFYRKAVAARPADQTLYRDLAEILIAQARRSDSIALLESMPRDGLRRADILILLSQAYYDEQRYTEAIDLLESTPYFVNWEGQSTTWDIFHRSHMQRGRGRLDSGDLVGAVKDFKAAITYPANLGVGRSNKPEEAAGQYWLGKALAGLGRQDEARSAWKAGAAGPAGSDEQNEHRRLCEEALR